MLEGVVARLLNQLLGKYVIDLDTENLNVGIFSGNVQMTDVRLKSEALYELELPIEVTAGTIGKIWLQIPWNKLLSQSVKVNIENIHILAKPVVRFEKFNSESNKKLVRAFKKRVLAKLESEKFYIGGPQAFAEHLVANIINNMQINVTNVHIRYEDDINLEYPVAFGFCIGSISAEPTNRKWKACQKHESSSIWYYLIKIESLFTYCNENYKPIKWNFPVDYYKWRNYMANTLQNFMYNEEEINFLLKPMTLKTKMTINKSEIGSISKINSEVIVQDCSIQITKIQYKTIYETSQCLSRMLISWKYLYLRPTEKIRKNKKAWWKYAYQASLEQRVRPYTWTKIKETRNQFKKYIEAYKATLMNPNDTELKLDLQKHEDNLELIPIIIARQQAKQQVEIYSLADKSLWTILPSPERTILCDKIGFSNNFSSKKEVKLEHQYQFQIGNICISLLNRKHQEILMVTFTQLILYFEPNVIDETFILSFKLEGIVVEGANKNEHLVPIICSEHGPGSPAYFLKIDLEKKTSSCNCSYKFKCNLSTVDITYDAFAFQELNNYLHGAQVSVKSLVDTLFLEIPKNVCRQINRKVLDFWDIKLSINVPILIIPQDGNKLENGNVLILDLGKIDVSTELWKRNDVLEFVTQMEMEEQLYSRLQIQWTNVQILFGNSKDNWKESMKEKHTDMHVLPKTKLTMCYAMRVRDVPNIPKTKFSSVFENLKINVKERKLFLMLDFCHSLFVQNDVKDAVKINNKLWLNDVIEQKLSANYYKYVVNIVKKSYTLNRPKRKEDKEIKTAQKKRNSEKPKQDMNEAWARTVDLPGLEDNISPSNNIGTLVRLSINEFTLSIFQSIDESEKQYLSLKLQDVTMDLAFMTYGPAYQVSVKSICLTDKLHTTSSGQFLDIIYSPYPCKEDVFVLLYRKVDAKCPEFWTHFHGVETSLVMDFETIYLILHQESIETMFRYSKYLYNSVLTKIPETIIPIMKNTFHKIENELSERRVNTPVPPGAVKYSQSGRLNMLNVKICAVDYDIMDIQIAGLEIDLLFKANERFVFKSFLRYLNVEHLSEVTLYPKILSTDSDKVYEIKYVQNAPHLVEQSPSGLEDKVMTNGTFKFFFGRIHVTFLYKLIVQFQRFLKRVEATFYVEKIFEVLSVNISQVRETLKPNSKIQLAINVQGPVVLIPQKSDSPNVLILDTGTLNIENFFKRNANDIVDNILVKIDKLTLSRAVMGLTENIETQETILEPVLVNLDIKNYMFLSGSLKADVTWEVDGIIDVIEVNLGQKDLSILLACYIDNIGEGKILNLFPEKAKTPVKDEESLEAVRKLESFFCKPKEKYISIKLSVDGVNIKLFFDPSELLSSPIRDLNHGFCKIELSDIFLLIIKYTDTTLEGKFNAQVITIKEISSDYNPNNKFILQPVVEDILNNNTKVQIRKTPVIDINFNQNKSYDKSIDIIVGSLSLTLSVPIIEKIAIFVLESLPKHSIELGIINQGYTCDQSEQENVVGCPSSSLTVALRINKPEIIFAIVLASKNEKRFVTKAEVLLDYSRHNENLNLVLSLSGIHSLFYDSCLINSDPYVVLKRCELELARNYSEDRQEKISLSISPIELNFCDRVIHTFSELLNEITEHFKIPEEHQKLSKSNLNYSPKKQEQENIWESKKIPESNGDETTTIYVNSRNYDVKSHQIFLMSKTDLLILFHLEEHAALMLKSSVEMTVYGWSHLLNSTCQVTIQANYFNKQIREWEPFIDPVVVNENEFKPWEIIIKVFQDRAMPIVICTDSKSQKDSSKTHKRKIVESFSADEDTDEDMIYLEPPKNFRNHQKRRITTSLSSFLQESDSENEEGSNDKLVSAISDLFTGDWNESEVSSVESSSSDEEEEEKLVEEQSKSPKDENNKESIEKSTYIMIDGKETLNISITPDLLKVLMEMNTIYFGKTLSVIDKKGGTILVNEIGSNTKIELFQKRSKDSDQEYILIDSKTYESEDSYPNSPVKENSEDNSKELDDFSILDSDLCCNFDILETFDFPVKSTENIYENVQKRFLKILVPGFLPVQTYCPNRNWKKLINLSSISSSETYCVVAQQNVGKLNTLTVSSPLEIRNETCFALSVFYEPAILQKLNLETMGSMKNPFESTIRMAVLEPHELFHVPLYIAFHCKLFIQPAYAETYYVSDKGLFWKNLASELDVPNYIICRPKDTTNQEVFSLKVEIEKNVLIKQPCSQFVPNYIIRLLPPFVLKNYLPYTLEVQNINLKQQLKIEPTETSSIYSVDMNKDQKFLFKLILQNSAWSGVVTVSKDFDEKVLVLTADQKNNNRQMYINIKANKSDNVVYVYVPYWVINKTGLPLEFKVSTTTTVFKTIKEDIHLLTFKPNMKRTISVKVYDSKWSQDFGLDAAGTTGLIVCKDTQRCKRYSFILSVNLSQTCPVLTKIAYLLPTFLVTNNTNKFLRFMEVNEKADLWIDLPPKETATFWPETSLMQMQVKYRDSSFISQPFAINSCLLTVLRMDRGSALSVQVEGGKSGPFFINFRNFQPGDAPVLIKNLCPEIHLKIQQVDQSISHVLNPNYYLYYTWDEPSKSRQLIWNVYNNKDHGFFIDIEKNGSGEERISQSTNSRNLKSQQSWSINNSSDEETDSAESILISPINRKTKYKLKIYWICYFDGAQRSLVFSRQKGVIEEIKKTHFMDSCHTELLLSLSGVGISLFSQHNTRKELGYFSISSSPSTWEVNVGHRWKILTLELASWIEDKYRLGYKKCHLKDYIHIDFEKMFMLKPFLAELRRSHNSGLYFQYRKANFNEQINLVLNFMQIDNKYSNSIVLRPMPSGNLRNVMPFIEFSSIFRMDRDFLIIKDSRMLVQNFYFNIDNTFNLKISELFTENLKIVKDELKCYRNDLKKVLKPVEFLSKDLQIGKNIVIENLKISGFNVQISLSNKTEEIFKLVQFPFSYFMSYFVPLQFQPFVIVQNIQQKITPFEIINLKTNFLKIGNDLCHNYKSQLLQQFYVHVMGLQVLVNPYSQSTISTNNTSCFEEIIPTSQLNVFRCLLGHLNMSSAALEQMITSVFSNQNVENIYRIGRHGSYQKNYDIPNAILESYRNFYIGVTLALEQLIIKNNSRETLYDGEAFFKSTGKALLSLILRHPDEKSNSLIIALEAIQRAALLNEPIYVQRRLTRYCNKYLGLKPFSGYESLGNYLTETIQNGRFASDVYWSHAALNKNSKSIIIVTTQHLIKVNKFRMWGQWEVDWCLDLDDVVSVPTISDNYLVITVKKGEYKFVNSSGLLEIEGNKEILIWLKEKIQQAMLISLEEKSWTLNDDKN